MLSPPSHDFQTGSELIQSNQGQRWIRLGRSGGVFFLDDHNVLLDNHDDLLDNHDVLLDDHDDLLDNHDVLLDDHDDLLDNHDVLLDDHDVLLLLPVR